MIDKVTISVKTLKIDNGYFLEKDFAESIYMNAWMVLYLTVNQVDS